MQKHVKVYLEYFGFPDYIKCEVCPAPAVEIHHVIFRSKWGSKRKDEQDSIGNLLACCRNCHKKAHDGILSKEFLLDIIKNRG